MVRVGDIYPAKGKGPRFWLVISIYNAGKIHGSRCCLLGLDSLEEMNIVSAQTYGSHAMERRELIAHVDVTQMRFNP